MKIDNIDLSAYPNSDKVYVEGKLFPIKVGMRVIHQYPTVKIEDGKRVEYPNEDITVYDTSGLYTDPDYTVDINKGLPRHREAWVEQRNDTTSQVNTAALAGIIPNLTPSASLWPTSLVGLRRDTASLRCIMPERV